MIKVFEIERERARYDPQTSTRNTFQMLINRKRTRNYSRFPKIIRGMQTWKFSYDFKNTNGHTIWIDCIQWDASFTLYTVIKNSAIWAKSAQLSIRPKIWPKFIQNGGILPKTVEIRPFFGGISANFRSRNSTVRICPFLGKFRPKWPKWPNFLITV
jgi:hypothetical protein